MGRRIPWIAGAVLVLVAAGIWVLRHRPPPPAATEALVRAECSRCHAFPPPDVLPRELWRKQIEHMAFLSEYLAEGGEPPPPLSVDEIAAWYEERAPERLPFEPALTRDEAPPLRFRRRAVLLGDGGGPGVATVTPVPPEIAPRLSPSLAAPNMSNGSVHLFSLRRGPLLVGQAGHPARVAPGDFDGDGRVDLVVSDLGNPLPSDEPVGRVVVLQNRGAARFEAVTVLEGVGRVADAQPIDLDGDGDLDLVVGAFGWLHLGGVYALRNDTPPGGPLAFTSTRVSPRAGVVSVVPLAPDAAGRPTFAAAFAQHFELVSLFTARADGGFDERPLWSAPHPNWGTSNLSAADLDGDGDLDLLLANGDTLDDGVAFKPWHGVLWLENRGDEGFVEHRIGALYGAQAAAAGDLDGDGDVDVVASGFLPQVQLPVGPGPARVDSVIWFEHRGDEWIPWGLEANHPRHTGIALADVDGDGRLDVVAAINRAWDATEVETGPALELWQNLGPAAADAP